MYRHKARFAPLLISKAPQIRLAVKESANAIIKEVDTFPQPTLECLHNGWAQVPPGYCALLLSCAPDDCKEPGLDKRKGPVLEIRKNLKEAEKDVMEWDCGTAAVVPELLYYRTEPAGIPYGSIPVPLSRL
jgi:hypothetical protein